MSRIGKVPIDIPSGVQVTISPEMVVSIKGSKGEASIDTKSNVTISQKDGKISVERHSDASQDRAFHGLYHRLLTNAITGVTVGYRKDLEMVGVGYKADKVGNRIELKAGFSHDLIYEIPAGITINIPKPTKIEISGSDKQQVNQAAAKIRAMHPPEPYKGKGIRYLGEQVKRKVGKTGAK